MSLTRATAIAWLAKSGAMACSTTSRGRSHPDSGAVREARAGKALESSARPGPRTLGLEAISTHKRRAGRLWVVSGGQRSCETYFTLSANS